MDEANFQKITGLDPKVPRSAEHGSADSPAGPFKPGTRLPEKLTPDVWAMIDAHRNLGVLDAATYRKIVGCYGAQDRKTYLMLLHPDESPGLVGEPAGCVNPPSRFRPNAKWIHFRDSFVIPMIQACPENPNWPRYLAQVETILAWRAAIPAEDRFWRADP